MAARRWMAWGRGRASVFDAGPEPGGRRETRPRLWGSPMAYRLHAFSDVGLNEALLRLVIDEHTTRVLPRLNKLWTYFRNPLRPVGLGGPEGWQRSGRWYRQAQEIGLPARVVGDRVGGSIALDDRFTRRREVVIENDIAWRVQAMIDFMFGRPVRVRSTAKDAATRDRVERALDAVWEASGGIALLQDAALMGHVFGHVDLMLHLDEAVLADRGGAGGLDAGGLEDELRGGLAGAIRIEAIEPRRGIAVIDPNDWRRTHAYVVHYRRAVNEPAAGSGSALDRLLARARAEVGPGGRRTSVVTRVIGAARVQTYVDEQLVEDRALTLLGGRLPVVHIQNVSQPLSYEGLGEVEALIPLQDELNTRLSDRASRVALQSFKMYLAKGIEGFEQVAVGPGQIWSTNNPDAEVKEFGGDAHSPSEEAHIQEIREAIDKVSGVPPLASGVVRAKLGNLTSATALRITLMGMLAKTMRKRVTYGRGIAEMSRLVLTALDGAGLLGTSESERGVRLEWPDPVPVDERDLIANVKAKAELGVPKGELLDELGHAGVDAGIQ